MNELKNKVVMTYRQENVQTGCVVSSRTHQFESAEDAMEYANRIFGMLEKYSWENAFDHDSWNEFEHECLDELREKGTLQFVFVCGLPRRTFVDGKHVVTMTLSGIHPDEKKPTCDGA